MTGIGNVGVIVRLLLVILCLFICIWGLLPSLTGRFHSGCLTMILVGALGFLVSVFFPQVAEWCKTAWQSGIGKAMLSGAAVVVAALVLLFIGVSVCMMTACTKKPSEDATVIVLGAALRGEQPSRLLRGRLDAAVLYLSEHPDAVCVVSGGQGEDEICTESSVMKRYLLERGIAAERIYEEDRSTSTFENIQFSRELIETHGLSTEVAIVTQEFHQFRAGQFVKKSGLTLSGGITAHTPWYLLASYWIRDFAGICHMALLGT